MEAAIQRNDGFMSIETIIRDHWGTTITSYAKTMSISFLSIIDVELVALKEGLLLAQGLNLLRQCLKMLAPACLEASDLSF